MAQKSGFFNTEYLADGTPDRKYDADTYTDWLAAWISDGVRRSGEDDYKVSASGGMALKVNPGYAMVGGKWTHNDSEFTGFAVPTAPSGDRKRIDRIVIRRDSSISVRDAFLAYKQGEEAVSPAPPALTRSGSVYEIAIADILVRPAVTSVSASDITDQRGNKDVCGWVTTPVGYDDYFVSLDSKFDDWFQGVRERVATVTMPRFYRQRITVESAGKVFTFSIAQYDPTGVDQVFVYVNGLMAIPEIDYTLSGSTITFAADKVAGTDIDVTVLKSVDATGLGDVQDEVEELQEQVATIKNIGEYLYICNGYDDNVKLSQIAQGFFSNGPENGQLAINVYGTFGANAPFSGTGESTSRYRWMVLGSEAATSTKRVTFDFLNCSPINLNGEAGKHYICFYGSNCTVRNATVVARQRNTEGSVVVFVSPSNTGFVVENSRIDLSAYLNSWIAGSGTFRDCYGTVTNSRASSYCFALDGLLRVFGGSYTAYTGLSSETSYVFGSRGSSAGALFSYGVNCPSVSKAAHYQNYAAYFDNISGSGILTGLVTPLECDVSESAGKFVLRDRINANYPSVNY